MPNPAKKYRLQRATRAPSRYIPPQALRPSKQKPRRRAGAAGAQPSYDWRLNTMLGLEVEPVSPGKTRLQQRMHFRVSTSYKRSSVQSWAHASVVVVTSKNLVRLFGQPLFVVPHQRGLVRGHAHPQMLEQRTHDVPSPLDTGRVSNVEHGASIQV